MLIFTHRDVPGLIGFIGTIFGKHKVNIAQMTVGRQHARRRGDRRAEPRSTAAGSGAAGSAGPSADQQPERGEAAAGGGDAAVVAPVDGGGMDSPYVWIAVGLAGAIIFGRRPFISLFPPHWWYLSSTKRHAIRRAVEAAEQLHHSRVSSAGCWIIQKDPKKCFVFLEHRPRQFIDAFYSAFAVWSQSGIVDDLGVHQFCYGSTPARLIEKFEHSLGTKR